MVRKTFPPSWNRATTGVIPLIGVHVVTLAPAISS